MKKFLLSFMALCVAAHLVSGEIVAPVRLVNLSGIVNDDPYPMKRMSLPIENAKVELWRSSAVYDVQSSPVIGPVPYWQRIDSVYTDGQGKFTFKPINAGSYQLRCSHSGYADNQVTVNNTLRDTSVTISLVAASAKAQITGTISEACHDPMGMPCIITPIPQCTVTVTKGSGLLEPALIAFFTTVTNNNGQYTFDSIPVSKNGERITISATKKGYATKSVDTLIRNTATTTVNIVLTGKEETSKDSVSILPAFPTSRDSLQFQLRSWMHCCGTIYRNKTVSVHDTTILLSSTYDDSMCAFVECLVGWSITTFSSGPIKAGKYAIYKVESPYCSPGKMCPQYITAPVRIGTVIVAKSTGIEPSAMKTSVEYGNRLTMAGNSVIASVTYSQPVSLRVYDMRGALLAELFNGVMSAGTHHFELNKALGKQISRGTLLVQLLANGKIAEAKTVTVLH
jgi:hypothetical protein